MNEQRLFFMTVDFEFLIIKNENSHTFAPNENEFCLKLNFAWDICLLIKKYWSFAKKNTDHLNRTHFISFVPSIITYFILILLPKFYKTEFQKIRMHYLHRMLQYLNYYWWVGMIDIGSYCVSTHSPTPLMKGL